MRKALIALAAIVVVLLLGGYWFGLFPTFSDFDDELVVRRSELVQSPGPSGTSLNCAEGDSRRTKTSISVGLREVKGHGTCSISAIVGADIKLKAKPSQDREYDVTLRFKYSGRLATADGPASANLRVIGSGPSGILELDRSLVSQPKKFDNITVDHGGAGPNPRTIPDTAGSFTFILPIKANSQDTLALRIEAVLTIQVGDGGSDPGEASGQAFVELVEVTHTRR